MLSEATFNYSINPKENAITYLWETHLTTWLSITYLGREISQHSNSPVVEIPVTPETPETVLRGDCVVVVVGGRVIP